MRGDNRLLPWGDLLPSLLTGALVVTALAAAAVIAPTESTMGHAQRILYLHVSVGWLGLL